MVRILKKEFQNDGVPYIEAAGLADDDKPTGDIATGSLFLESDTGDVYSYDEVGGTWAKIAALLGGGS